MQMQYRIGCPGSENAGTRTLSFTTGGGGSFGKQSSGLFPDSGGSPSAPTGDPEIGNSSIMRSATPRASRAQVKVVFMKIQATEVRRKKPLVGRPSSVARRWEI